MNLDQIDIENIFFAGACIAATIVVEILFVGAAAKKLERKVPIPLL